MPITTERFKEDPIFILTFEGHNSPRSVIDAYLATVDEAQQLGVKVYRIIDLRDSIPQMAGIIRHTEVALSEGKPNVELPAIYLAPAPMIDHLKERGFTAFKILDDALTYIRSHVSMPVAS